MIASAWGKHRQDFGTLVSILNAANSLNAANQERGHEERCDCEYTATVDRPGSPKPFCASAVAHRVDPVSTANGCSLCKGRDPVAIVAVNTTL